VALNAHTGPAAVFLDATDDATGEIQDLACLDRDKADRLVWCLHVGSCRRNEETNGEWIDVATRETQRVHKKTFPTYTFSSDRYL